MKEKLENRIFQLDFAVEKSMRYHQRRRGWYDGIHRIFMVVIIASGSVAGLYEGLPEGVRGYLSVFVAVLAVLDLVFGLYHRARDHEVLFRRFSDLAVKIRTSSHDETEHGDEYYKEWVKERINIEKDEPPIYMALEADCDNEVRHALGRTEGIVKIGWWSRFAMHLLRQERKKFLPEAS